MEKIDNGMEGCRSTIIIPNYNGMAYLENCLASLRGEPARVIPLTETMVFAGR